MIKIGIKTKTKKGEEVTDQEVAVHAAVVEVRSEEDHEAVTAIETAVVDHVHGHVTDAEGRVREAETVADPRGVVRGTVESRAVAVGSARAVLVRRGVVDALEVNHLRQGDSRVKLVFQELCYRINVSEDFVESGVLFFISYFSYCFQP